MRATPRPGCAIRRRAGSGPAPRSAASPRKCRGRCCADGTPTTASCSAIPGSASSAPGRPSTASRGWRATTRSGIAISRPRSGCSFRPASAVRRSSADLAPRLPGEHMAGGTAAEGTAQLCDGVRHLDRAGNDRRARPGRGRPSRRRRGAAGRDAYLRRGRCGCWAAWKRARRVSPRPSPGWPAGRTMMRNCSWKVRARPCARRRGA